MFGNLQWESTYNEGLRSYTVIKGSERLYCPVCKHEHVEADKEWCITNGDFVHRIPELIDERPSFQVGALASQLPSLSWSEIANFALEAGKTADMEIQKQFDNSIRGLPYIQRTITKDEIAKLRDNHTWHVAPSLDNVELVFGCADVMDDFISYAVFAWDVNDHLYMIADGKLQYLTLTEEKRKQIDEQRRAENLPPIEVFEDYVDKEFLKNKEGSGIKSFFWIIDQGGHRRRGS